MLKNVGEFWAKNPQMIELVIDILLNAKLVDPFQVPPLGVPAAFRRVRVPPTVRQCDTAPVLLSAAAARVDLLRGEQAAVLEVHWGGTAWP